MAALQLVKDVLKLYHLALPILVRALPVSYMLELMEIVKEDQQVQDRVLQKYALKLLPLLILILHVQYIRLDALPQVLDAPMF